MLYKNICRQQSKFLLAISLLSLLGSVDSAARSNNKKCQCECKQLAAAINVDLDQNIVIILHMLASGVTGVISRLEEQGALTPEVKAELENLPERVKARLVDLAKRTNE